MPTGLFIAGKWEAGERTVEVKNKYSLETIGQVAVPSAGDIDRALASAVRGAKAMAELPTYRRVEILAKTSAHMAEHREELARTIAAEAGKPLKFARGEVDRAVTTFQLASEEARRIHGETLAMDAVPNGEGFFGFWWRKPVGVVGAITPFNFPLNLVAHKLAPAIAAGNAFVLKPAELTPLTAVTLMEILLECGLPPEAGQLLPGSGKTVGQAIVTDSRVGKVTFTGSATVGQQILAQAGIKKVTLELGNSSPVIVAPDADLDYVAKRCAIGAFAHSGQVCISVQRIFGDRTIEGELRDRMVEATRSIVVGDPLDEQTDVGPMIAEKEAERIEQWVQEAERQGARRLIGGQREGAIYYPTLLEHTRPEMKVINQEVFAPVASLIACPDFEESLRQANATGYGLQAAVFTRDINRVLEAIRELDFGGVIINDMPGFRVDHMPYGGNKQSGLGREGVRFAIEEMTNIQTVAIKG
ncbi:MAG: aldehyde dehydrogenase family protein [Aureliella sp.]